MGIFTEEIAIDLGTANTLIIHNDKVVINSPSIVAIDRTTNKIIAIGDEANIMQGKTHENIKTVRPLKDGVIADFEASEQMINTLIKSIPTLKKRWFSPSLTMVICIPSGITEVEMRAVKESAERVNGKEVYLIHEPMAAAIGIGIDVSKPVGNMIVDIGGGTTEVAVLSLGGIVYATSLRVAGDTFDDAIINYVRRRHGLLIGEATAERVKKAIGTAWIDSDQREMEIKGRDVAEGMSRSLIIGSDEVYDSISDSLTQIVRVIRETLENTPPELAADIGERGMVIAGGGALIRDMDRRLMQETGLPVVIADDPLTCVARGCGRALEDMAVLGDVFTRE